MILTDKNKVKEILTFNDECVYTLIAVARKKDNEGLTNSTEIVFREIVNSEEQFDKKYDRLIKAIEKDSHNFKLYITFNPRSILKAYNLMKQKFLMWDNELINTVQIINPDNKHYVSIVNRIGRIHYEWISCLQKQEAIYKKNYFMLDVDEKLNKRALTILNNKVKRYCTLKGVNGDIIKSTIVNKEEIKTFSTQNGHHILLPICDTRKLMENLKEKYIVELKRDALVCIGYYDKENKE